MSDALSFIYPRHTTLDSPHYLFLESWAITHLHLFISPQYESIINHFIHYAKENHMDLLLERDPTSPYSIDKGAFSETFSSSLLKDTNEKVQYIRKNIETVIRCRVERYYNIVIALADETKKQYQSILKWAFIYNNQSILFSLPGWKDVIVEILSPNDIIKYIDYHGSLGFRKKENECLFLNYPFIIRGVLDKNLHIVSNYCCKEKKWDALSFIADHHQIELFPDYEGMIYFSAHCDDYIISDTILNNVRLEPSEWVDCLVVAIVSENEDMVEWMIQHGVINRSLFETKSFSHKIIQALPRTSEKIQSLIIKFVNESLTMFSKYTVSYSEDSRETFYIQPFFGLSTDYQYKAFIEYFVKDMERIDYIESIPQRTDEWLEARKGMISGTGIGPALGHNMKYMPPEKFILEKLFSLFKGNDATNWGTYIEPLSEDMTYLMLKQYYRKKYLHIPFIFDLWDDGFRINSSHPWLGVSSDGHFRVYSLERNDSDGGNNLNVEKGTIEIKSPYTLSKPYSECPHYYYDQFQAAAYTLYADTIAFVVFTTDTVQLNIYDYDRTYIENYVIPLLFHFHVTELFPRIILNDKGFFNENDQSISPSTFKILNYVNKNPDQRMFVQ